jgi:hypothetical protein
MDTQAGRDAATVVIGVDDSGLSLPALHWGCGEARRLGGHVVAVVFAGAPERVAKALYSAAGWVAAGFTLPDAADGEQLEWLTAELLCEADDLEIEVVHAAGNPVTELRRIAAEAQAGLMVVSGSVLRPRALASVDRLRASSTPHGPVIVVVP